MKNILNIYNYKWSLYLSLGDEPVEDSFFYSLILRNTAFLIKTDWINIELKRNISVSEQQK